MIEFLVIILCVVLLLLVAGFVLNLLRESRMGKHALSKSAKPTSKHSLTPTRMSVISTELLNAIRTVISLLWHVFRVFILTLAVILIILLIF